LPSLPINITGDMVTSSGIEIPPGKGSLTEVLEDIERQLIIRALDENKGSQTAAASSLGLKRSTLRYKLEKYGLVSGEAEDDENPLAFN